MPVITCVEDLRLLAKKRVPKAFYDYADSGSYTESTYRANSDDLAAIKTRLDRVESRLDGVESRLDRVEHKVDGLTTNLPRVVGEMMREVLRERDGQA